MDPGKSRAKARNRRDRWTVRFEKLQENECGQESQGEGRMMGDLWVFKGKRVHSTQVVGCWLRA